MSSSEGLATTLNHGTLEGVRFQPWVGPKYQAAFPKLLVLGESHYDWEGREIPEHLVTTQVILDAIDEGHGPFFTDIVATCTGKLPDTNGRRRFWEAVAFYNYVQEFVGDGPRIRPSEAMWCSAEKAYAAVLSALQPDLILVLGVQNWDNIANSGRSAAPLTTGPERYRETWEYLTGPGKTALAFHVKHPAAGYNFREYFPLFSEAKSRAAEKGAGKEKS